MAPNAKAGYGDCCIYAIRNRLTREMCYVGSTALPNEVRMGLHMVLAYYKRSSDLHKHMWEQGLGNFSIEPLVENLRCENQKELTQIEERFRKKLNPRYNMRRASRVVDLKGQRTLDYYKGRYGSVPGKVGAQLPAEAEAHVREDVPGGDRPDEVGPNAPALPETHQHGHAGGCVRTQQAREVRAAGGDSGDHSEQAGDVQADCGDDWARTKLELLSEQPGLRQLTVLEAWTRSTRDAKAATDPAGC